MALRQRMGPITLRTLLLQHLWMLDDEKFNPEQVYNIMQEMDEGVTD